MVLPRGRGGRGGDRGGFRKPGREASGELIEVGTFNNAAPTAMVFKASTRDVPMFNQTIYKDQQGKKAIGKVEEILGPVGAFMFSVMPVEGLKPDSLRVGEKAFIDKAFFLPLNIFLNPPKPVSRGGGGARYGGFKGGRGGFGRGGGGFRGNSRGSRGGRGGGFRNAR